MKCVICKQGDTASGQVTVTLQRGETVVIIRDVPAQVCQDCGEYYLDEPVAARVVLVRGRAWPRCCPTKT